MMAMNKASISRGKNIASLTLLSSVEHCITVHNNGAGTRPLADIASDNQAAILSQYVFAASQDYDRQADPRTLWLQGDASQSGETHSAQATAIAGLPLKEVAFNGKTVGVSYEDEAARYCRLSGLRPDDLAAPPAEQTRSLFENLNKALQAEGFQFNDVLRTWCYLDHLLEWYDTFNLERTAFFEAHGVFDKLVPASTGIGAANAWGAALAVDLLAVRPKNGKMTIEAAASPLQDSATDYGSSFSRAVELNLATHRALYISGTASIDRNGNTLYQDEPKMQIAETMRVIEALLRSRGMGWDDLFRGIVYYKDMNSLPVFEAYCRENKIADFPLAISHADICRDDLLFEIELDAIKINE
jgi:enamine deaminase RidA (YjgF/YER057c/UK114 family)